MQDRAGECQQMAEHAPNTRIRDILLDIARTWRSLALEAEHWSQMNRPTKQSGDLLTFCRSAARPERDERSAKGVSDFMAPLHENLYGQDN